MRKVYYNEFDPFAAEWLKKLISYGYLPNGDVDSRSIKDVRATDLVGYTQLHFFAGIGGWPLALEQAGWGDRPVWTGSCPCFVEGTLVLTSKGLTPIEKIEIGDLVVTHQGQLKPVTHIGSDYKETIVVKGQGNSVGITTTSNHPFLARDKGIEHRRKHKEAGKTVFKSEPYWCEAYLMQDKYWASLLNYPHVKSPQIPFEQVKKGVFYDATKKGFVAKGEKAGKYVGLGIFPSKEDALAARSQAISNNVIDVRGADAFNIESLGAAYFLGFWFGDGWTTGNRVAICSHKDDIDLLRDIANKSNLRGSSSIERTSSRLSVGSKALVSWLRDNFGINAREKSLPTWIYSMPKEWRQSFLDGYLNADGHTSIQSRGGGKTRSYTTVSKSAAIGVKMLIDSLGKSSSLGFRKTKNRTIENRTVNTTGGFYRVVEYEKARSHKNDGQYGWGVVKSASTTGVVQRVYNIAVKDDESYIADGIVVHNCQPFSTAGKRKGFDDDRHLWPVFYDLIKECQPVTVIGEQVASKDAITWLDNLQNDLERSNYTVGSVIIPACGFGAPHIRQRLFWVASLQSGGGDESSRLANAEGIGYGQHEPNARAMGGKGEGNESQKPQARGITQTIGHCGEIDGMAIAGNDGAGSNNIETGGWGRESLDAGTEGIRQTQWSISSSGTNSGSTSSIDGMGNTTIKGLEGHNGDGNGSGEPRWNETDSTGHATMASSFGNTDGAGNPGPTNGFWRDADWLRCRDSKWRPVKPGTSALAHGLSTGVGSSRPRNRSQRLKGYGNAIAVPVAVEFIKAYMEIEE